MRRALTFYCRPPGFLFFFFPPEKTFSWEPMIGPISAEVWREHEEEFARFNKELLFRGINDGEQAAILAAGLAEAEPRGRPARSYESSAALNDAYHLALKLRVLGLEDKVRPLQPPRRRDARPAMVLHEGVIEDAGVRSDAREKLTALCRAWAEDSKEPFATLVARRGVIILHDGFGLDPDDKPVSTDYRCEVFSISKTVTAILFSQFLEQRLIRLDDSLASVFPDYPQDSPRVPTFRQCLTHTSGLAGHGDYGGVRNPHLDNIVLNGIDVNEPGKTYAYSGMGFDLVAEAMELVTGKAAPQLFRDHLFRPLGLGDIPFANASSDARLTARELGVLGQWLLNRGSYGENEFASPATFETMLPEDLDKRFPDIHANEGIGMHWMKDRRPGAPPGSAAPEDLIFSPRTIGHGSLSSCILRVDLERDIVVAQVRRKAGERFGEWSAKFLQAIADSVEP